MAGPSLGNDLGIWQMNLDREELQSRLNGSGIGSHLSELQRVFVEAAVAKLTHNKQKPYDYTKDDDDDKNRHAYDNMLLNHVGPAAASSAVEYAIHACKKQNLFRNVNFNGSFVNNVKLIRNEPGDPTFTSVLRQFLLPRYAYLDFDAIIDPRHRIDVECGYPKFITPIMYRYMYDRDDVASKVVDFYPNECWTVEPTVYETEPNREPESDFEKAWQKMCDEENILSYLYRMDRLSGIGHYGALLLGVDDGQDLETPIDEPELIAGAKYSVGKKQRDILYHRPFDEYLSFIHQYETDVTSPRYGKAKFYNLIFLDMTIDAAGASIGTRLNRRVHWTRVVHVADNEMSSLVFGIPRMQQVFNRLLDLRKIKGSSGEMFWNGAFPGISFEVDPKFVADQPEFDIESLKEEVSDYFNRMKRSIFLEGITAKTLEHAICEHPDVFVKIHEMAIANKMEVPIRIWMGTEEARLASAQETLTWNKRLKRRCKRHLNPNLLRNYIDRRIAIGAMPPPKSGQYKIDWPDFDSATPEDSANLALKFTQALSQYVSTGIIHLIEPMDYFTMILGLRPVQAQKLFDQIKNSGGFEKLKKVDPSKQGGQKENIADGAQGKKEPTKRDTATKQAEGTSS